LIVWLYYSTQIFLLGAEFTYVYARWHGSHAKASAPMNAPTPVAAYRAPPAANDPTPQGPFLPAQPGGLNPRIEAALAFMRKHPQATLGVLAGVGAIAGAAIKAKNSRRHVKATALRSLSKS